MSEVQNEIGDESLTVREMQAGDAEEVALLAAQLGYDRSAEHIRISIRDLNHCVGRQAAFVACVAHQVVGWIEVSIERRLQTPAFALIGGLVVKEGIRSRGIGRQLCERAEAWSWEQGIDTVRVTSRSTRADAHRFYFRNGYELVKTSTVFEKKSPERRRP